MVTNKEDFPVPKLARILERDENGIPRLNLIPLKKTGIHVPTIENYLELKIVWKCAGWKWEHFRLLDWKKYKKETCIDADVNYGFTDKDFYLQNGWEVISKQEFYERQELRITPSIIEEINQSFGDGLFNMENLNLSYFQNKI